MWTRENTEATWASCVPPYSFYHDFIARYWAGGPSEDSGAPIHRLCTLARKMSAASILIEDCLHRPDVADEVAHLDDLSNSEGTVLAATVTFLRCPPLDDAATVATADVIGQATIITFPGPSGSRSYIFEAIVRLPCKGADNEQLLNNHVPVSSDLEVVIRGHSHRIPASYYCQQNNVTSICAHCAVRTLARTLIDRRVSVSELNRLWNYDADTRSVRTVQVQDALRGFNLRPVTYNLAQQVNTVSEYRSDNVWGLLALLADSGSPSLLVLSAQGPEDHVVPVLGHTFNSDEWHPLGEMLHINGQNTMSSSNLWVDHLIIHDDLLGPYFCLSRAGLFPERDGAQHRLAPKQVIAIIPEGVRVSPIQAEDFARLVMPNLLQQINRFGAGQGIWWDFFNKSYERRIFRTTLVHRDAYAETLRPMAQAADDHAHIDQLVATLPDQLWMCELTLPNLFLANRAKLGEFLINAQTFPDEDDPLSGLCAVRLPSLLGWPRGEAAGGGFALVPWPEVGHIPIRAPLHHANRW